MRPSIPLFRWFSIALLLGAVAMALLELVAFSRISANIPYGVTIADVPVSGLSKEEAAQLLLQVYQTPVEVHYQQEIFYVTPAQVGFEPDLESMLAAADALDSGGSHWEGFWDYLWQNPGQAHTIPLKAQFSDAQINALLTDIAARYDLPPAPPRPIPGTTDFAPGAPGHTLNRERSFEQLKAAFSSAHNRLVYLPVTSTGRAEPTLSDLELLIRQVPRLRDFEGLMDVYLIDLQTGRDLHIIEHPQLDLPSEPDIAFAAASIIKIPILLAVYRDLDGAPDAEKQRWMEEMITLSGNDPSDWLMRTLDRNLGPLVVTDMLMKDLKLRNTFISMYFAPNSTALDLFATPANTRQDFTTFPDPYNQTTPTDIGWLLEDIYQCAQGGGTLLAVYPGRVTPEECRSIIDLMAQNIEGSLIKAGVPEGTKVSHKNGWTTKVDTLGDAAIVFSPGGNYVLTAFFYYPQGYMWDLGTRMMSELSQAAYNFFNPPAA